MAKQRFRDVKQGKVAISSEPKPVKKSIQDRRYATAGEKVKAFLTDSFMLLMPIMYAVFYLIMGGREGFAAHKALGWLYILIPLITAQTLFMYKSGQTPGYRAYDLEVIDESTGKTLPLSKSHARPAKTFVAAAERLLLFLLCPGRDLCYFYAKSACGAWLQYRRSRYYLCRRSFHAFSAAFCFQALHHTHTTYPYVETIALATLSKSHYGKVRLWGSLGFMGIALWLGKVLSSPMEALYYLSAMTFLTMLFGSQLIRYDTMEHENSVDDNGFSLKRYWAFWVSVFLMQVGFGGFYNFFTIYETARCYRETCCIFYNLPHSLPQYAGWYSTCSRTP